MMESGKWRVESGDYRRVLDANLNRVREGLRVCEDIVRFVWEREEEYNILRELRHRMTQIAKERLNLTQLIQQRKVETDIGRGIDSHVNSPENVLDLFLMNIQRAKEGLRVLEEFSRWVDPSIRQAFQTLRYEVYQCEQKIIQEALTDERFSSLRHSG